ncbi:MAG: hypothetical protein H7250_08325 [Flavobacterium sp.]|nr:hypothetical protein [Flavobacterium sp.]
MTIAELFREKKISHRSYHVCKANKIEDLQQLDKYLFTNKNFLKLHNCGQKSNSELLELLKNYKDLIKIDEKLPQLKLFNSIFPTSSNQNQKLINSIISILTNNLSIRNRNALAKYIGEELTFNILVNKIYENKEFKMTKIKDVGQNSIIELETYLNTIKAIAITVLENQKLT